MNIIKVNITVCFDNSENTGIAHGGIDLVKEIQLTEEQFEYLCEEDRALGRKRRAEFQNLREDFQAMAKELVLPYTNFFHQQLVAEGTDDAAARAVIDNAYCCVSLWGPYFDNKDEEPRDEQLETLLEQVQANGEAFSDVYERIPEMLAEGNVDDALAMMNEMAEETIEVPAEGGNITVAKIPTFTTFSGLVIDLIALAQKDDGTTAFYVVEKDDDNYWLEHVTADGIASLGPLWKEERPTMQQVAEEVMKVKG